MISPKEIEIDGKTYVISKLPVVDGREICFKYPIANMPKVGEYSVSEEVMLKLMTFVSVKLENGQLLKLSHKELVNNHTATEFPWETLGKLEAAMIEYNVSFFQNGRASNFLDGFALKLPTLITKMLTLLSGQSFPAEKPRSTN
jgi:hypothetical protein